MSTATGSMHVKLLTAEYSFFLYCCFMSLCLFANDIPLSHVMHQVVTFNDVEAGLDVGNPHIVDIPALKNYAIIGHGGNQGLS